MFHRILAGTRLSILIAVTCSFVVSVTLLIYGAIQTFVTVRYALSIGHSSQEAKTVILAFIEIIDLFLLATVFYITALGLYALFIDDRIKVPGWLEIHNLDDLKGKLASVVIVILSVVFLGQAVKWDGGTDLLAFGTSVALVIASLTYFLSEKNKKPKLEKSELKMQNRPESNPSAKLPIHGVGSRK
jgi:uncharacterized membrane protein YqhA